MRSLLLAVPVSLMLFAAPAFAGPSYRGVTINSVRGGMTLNEIERDLTLAKRAGANVVRTEIRWEALEPTPDGGVDPQTLALADGLVSGAAARGMKVVAMVVAVPCWASDAPAGVKGDCSTQTQRLEASRYGPVDPSRFGRIAAFIAARYGSRLAGIEVWNEPDQANELYLRGPDKPRRYAALLKAGYVAVKAVSPSTRVLGGTFVGGNGNFLRALYDEGIKGFYDVMSVHFYDETLWSLRETRKVMRAYGDHKAVWLGEFGYSSCYPRMRLQGGQLCVPRAFQGRRINDVLRGLRRAPYVQGAIVYQLMDTLDYDMGIYTRVGKRKPSFALVSAALKKKNLPSPRKVKMTLRRSGGRVVVSGSGPGGDFYDLSVTQHGQLRYRAWLKLSRSLRFTTTLPAALGVSGLSVRLRYPSGMSVTKRI